MEKIGEEVEKVGPESILAIISTTTCLCGFLGTAPKILEILFSSAISLVVLVLMREKCRTDRIHEHWFYFIFFYTLDLIPRKHTWSMVSFVRLSAPRAPDNIKAIGKLCKQCLFWLFCKRETWFCSKSSTNCWKQLPGRIPGGGEPQRGSINTVCKEKDIPHVINNAYCPATFWAILSFITGPYLADYLGQHGLQCRNILKEINKCSLPAVIEKLFRYYTRSNHHSVPIPC